VVQDSEEYDPADGDTEEDGDRDSAPVEEESSVGVQQSGEKLQLPTTNGDSSRQRFLEDQCALHTRSKARDGTKIIFLNSHENEKKASYHTILNLLQLVPRKYCMQILSFLSEWASLKF
jgi:hypothetical protein